MAGSRHYRLRLTVLLLGAAASLAATAGQAGPPSQPVRPNVIVILADDAGYADFGFQGSREFATPNIDALAREGVVFSAAYATTPFCSPSRAGLLTGRYPQRFGYEFNLTHAPPPGVDPRFMGLATEEKTLGTVFQSAGYRTIAVGKWHLGALPQFHPNLRGFQDFYGFLGGNASYFPEKVKLGTIERNSQPAKPSAYLTDDFAREATEYIGANRDRPFLLYLAFNAVHTPMDAAADDLRKVAKIADPQRRRLAAMTLGLDRAVGAVRAKLRQLKLDDRTLIVFTNDNGGDRIGLDAKNAPLRGTKGTLLEGGVRVPLIVRYPGRRAAGTRREDPVSLLDIMPTALAVAGLAAPGNLDGRSLAIEPASPNRTLYWRYDSMAAVREGQWKLLRYPDRPPELYDLTADIGERADRAGDEPGVVRRLMGQLFAWEGTVTHPRWNTGTFWSQEDVRRYSDAHVAAAIAEAKSDLEKDSSE